MNFQGIQQLKLLFATVAVGATVAGCSAGGAPQSTTTTPPPPSAASLNVAIDKSTLKSTGGDTAVITVTALDSSNNVVASIPVSIKPDSGVLTPAGTATGADGTVKGTLAIGADHTDHTINVVVTAGSITKTVAVNVTGDSLSATAGTGTAGSASTIQYTLVDAANSPIADTQITVSMPGQSDAVGKTDANGKYPFAFTMPSVSTVVVATAQGGVTTSTTVTPTNGTTVIPDAAGVTSPSLSANPSTVSTGKQVELRALFIGANNAPIPNVRARFTMVDSNSIGGTLSSDSADGLTHNVVYSDANGVARTTYTAGTRGGVITPKVCWSTTDFANDVCPNTVSASSVTVVASGVSLAVLTNGLLVTDDVKNIYSQNLVVQVVDASNQPISGSTVTGIVDIPRYYRGFYRVSGAAWTSGIYSDSTLGSFGARQACDNEDVNRNNVMESAEDMNASGVLEPFKASVTIAPLSSGSNVTDAFGKAYFTLQYGENYASWEDVILTFTTTVEGTEGHAAYSSNLPVPASVLTNVTASPPFVTSPYNAVPSSLAAPWLANRTPVTNPGVIYPQTATFNLCQQQQ